MVFSGNALSIYTIEESREKRKFSVPIQISRAQSIIRQSSNIEEARWKELVSDLLKDITAAHIKGISPLTSSYRTVVQWDKAVRTVKNEISAPDEKFGVVNFMDWRKQKTCSVDFLFLEKDFSLNSGVKEFLCNNTFLVPLLKDITEVLKQYFEGAHFFLEVVEDPEFSKNSQLLLSVGMDGEIEVAMEKLYNFDREWWLDNMSRGQERLCVDVISV